MRYVRNYIVVPGIINIQSNVNYIPHFFLGEHLDSYPKYADVISHMKASKVFVLPSTREGFGIVVLEANACGLPVITVNHKRNAACDLINGGNGFICELSEGDVAEKILIGLEKGKEMKAGCLEAARNYDWDSVSQIVESFYKSLGISALNKSPQGGKD